MNRDHLKLATILVAEFKLVARCHFYYSSLVIQSLLRQISLLLKKELDRGHFLFQKTKHIFQIHRIFAYFGQL